MLSVKAQLISCFSLGVSGTLARNEGLIFRRRRHFSATATELKLVISSMTTHLLYWVHHLRAKLNQLLFMVVTVSLWKHLLYPGVVNLVADFRNKLLCLRLKRRVWINYRVFTRLRNTLVNYLLRVLQGFLKVGLKICAKLRWICRFVHQIFNL